MPKKVNSRADDMIPVYQSIYLGEQCNSLVSRGGPGNGIHG